MTRLDSLRGEDGKLPAYAGPGGYQMIYVARDGSVLCPECANREIDDAQAVVDGDVFWEGAPMTCDDCGNEVESAYGDPWTGHDDEVAD